MFDIFLKWKEKIVQYVESQVRLVQLSFIERTAGVLSYFIFAIIIFFIIFGGLLFLGLGLAEWFTALTDSRISGFFLAGAFYIFLTLLLLACRKFILRIITNIFIRQLTEDDEEKDKDDDE